MIDTIPIVDPTGKLRPLADIESDVIANAIAVCRGNMSLAAKVLGIGRSTIYRKVRGPDQQQERTETK